MKNAVCMLAVMAAFAGNVFAAGVNDVSLTSAEYRALKQDMDLLKKQIAAGPTGHAGKSIAEELALGFEFSLIGVAQGTQNVNGGSAESRNVGSYRLDILAMKEFENAQAFVKLRAGESGGLDEYVASFGGVNAAAENENVLSVDELWYEHSLFKNKLIITFGKLSPTAYFDENAVANDEAVDFLAGSFINNAAIDFVDNNLGIRATYMPFEKLDITYAYIIGDTTNYNLDRGAFSALQANLKLFENANYRFMVWGNSAVKTDYAGGTDTNQGYGFALSLDHEIFKNITAFARLGRATPEYFEVESAISGGLNFNGAMWKRGGDKTAIAFGKTFISKDFVNAESLDDKPQTQAEAFYSIEAAKHLFITPSVQYLATPLSVGSANDNIYIYSVRAQVNF